MIKKATVLGGGIIGGGWAARLSLNGVNVTVYDTDNNAKHKIKAVLENAEAAFAKLTMAPTPPKGTVTISRDITEALAATEWVIEAVPERLDIKQAVYAEAEAAMNENTIIASSTSGIMPSDLQAKMRHPERLIVTHPFNPVYLLPLVEIVGGSKTSPQAIAAALKHHTAWGMFPLHVKKEIPAFVADRIMEAAWRECLWLVKDGIADTGDIDNAIRYGFGLRWAQMGIFETFRIAGGDAGMSHFLSQFGPCLKWPWTKLMEVPELNEALRDKITKQSDDQSGQHSVRELERIRDDNLIAILQSLKAKKWGAGKLLADYEKHLYDQGARQPQKQDGVLPTTFQTRVPADWTDYNNHMNESRYLQCFSDATDGLLRMLGINAEYIARGGTYFTAETHIRHLNEVTALEPIYATTQVLGATSKKLHLFHHLHHQDGRLLATGEHLLLHVNINTKKTAEAEAAITAKATALARQHATLPKPENAGRTIKDIEYDRRKTN